MRGNNVVQGAWGQPSGREQTPQFETFSAIDPAVWQGREPPRRDWMVENCFLRGTVALVSGDGGIGKCLGKGTPVLMFDGTVKPVEQVYNGDLVMGPDSFPRVVRGVTSGTGPLYRVTPVKGDSYVVNDRHVLSLKWTPRTNYRRPEGPINMTVGEFLDLPTQERRHLMGWRSGVEWAEKAVELPPYLLGLWLGDGSCGFPEITTADPQIVEPALREFGDRHGLTVVCRETACNGKARPWRLTGKKKHPNAFSVALRRLGVFKNKHIPLSYLATSSRARLELLAGLIDTDGSISTGCYEISQKRDAMAEGILFLARSLGFAAYDRVGMKSAQSGIARPYHRITISGDIDRIPVKLSYKRAAPRRQKKRVDVSAIAVESIGEGRFYGFEVDGDHLFLLGDFTVTHNSLLMQQLCTCAVLGRPWLGMALGAGRALYLACEDDQDELWRRQAAINRSLDAEMADVGEAGLALKPRVGQDNALMRFDRASWSMQETNLWRQLVRHCRDRGVQYVVIDTATQTFRGNQNDESQVMDYISLLRRLAIQVQGVVIITKHPSMAGRALGTGESGNVAWNNSVRARLYLCRNKGGDLVLRGMKSNYGKKLDDIPVQWRGGTIARLEAPPPVNYYDTDR